MRKPAASDLPAGVDPAEHLGPRPTTRRRGRVRRRLRHLRRMREVMLRDLGGLVYEINRTGADAAQADKLVGEKVARLHLLDAESEELEQRLGDPTGELLLREPGIGGYCPSCGELYGSDAAFCSQCGARVDREGGARS